MENSDTWAKAIAQGEGKSKKAGRILCNQFTAHGTTGVDTVPIELLYIREGKACKHSKQESVDMIIGQAVVTDVAFDKGKDQITGIEFQWVGQEEEVGDAVEG